MTIPYFLSDKDRHYMIELVEYYGKISNIRMKRFTNGYHFVLWTSDGPEQELSFDKAKELLLMGKKEMDSKGEAPITIDTLTADFYIQPQV